jgi:hypothetical protein
VDSPSCRLGVDGLAVFAVGVDDRAEAHGDSGAGESQQSVLGPDPLPAATDVAAPAASGQRRRPRPGHGAIAAHTVVGISSCLARPNEIDMRNLRIVGLRSVPCPRPQDVGDAPPPRADHRWALAGRGRACLDSAEHQRGCDFPGALFHSSGERCRSVAAALASGEETPPSRPVGRLVADRAGAKLVCNEGARPAAGGALSR